MKSSRINTALSLVASVLVVAGPIQAALQVDTLWSLAPGDRPYLTLQGYQRSMDYNPVTGHLLVANAVAGATQPTIHILDAETGEDLGLVSTEGVSGGHAIFNLLRVIVADDGTIYAGNLATNSATSTNGFRLYRWADEQSDPVLLFHGDPSNGNAVAANRRYGDWMVVQETGEDTRIILTTWQGGIISVMKPDGPDAFVLDKVITPTGIPAGELHTLSFGADNLAYLTFKNKSLHEAVVDLDAGTITQTRTFTEENLPILIQPTAVHSEMGVLAGLIDQHEVRFYYLADLTTEGEVPTAATVPFPNPKVYDHGGALRFVGNRLYAMGTDNGIMALELSETAGVSYANWIAGFGLSGEDAAADASPAGDGVSNLVKYALGLNPLTPAINDLPVSELVEDHLTITYQPNGEAIGIEAIVEVSDNLIDWVSGEGHTTIVENGASIIGRDNLSASERDRRFIRLRVVQK